MIRFTVRLRNPATVYWSEATLELRAFSCGYIRAWSVRSSWTQIEILRKHHIIVNGEYVYAMK